MRHFPVIGLAGGAPVKSSEPPRRMLALRAFTSSASVTSGSCAAGRRLDKSRSSSSVQITPSASIAARCSTFAGSPWTWMGRHGAPSASRANEPAAVWRTIGAPSHTSGSSSLPIALSTTHAEPSSFIT